MNQLSPEAIQTLRRIAKTSTNEVAKNGAINKLKAIGVPLEEESPKEEAKSDTEKKAKKQNVVKKDILSKFNKNEDNNFHSENAILLAENFGTEEDLKKAMLIKKQHEKEGRLTRELQIERDELLNKLYPKLLEKSKSTKLPTPKRELSDGDDNDCDDLKDLEEKGKKVGYDFEAELQKFKERRKIAKERKEANKNKKPLSPSQKTKKAVEKNTVKVVSDVKKRGKQGNLSEKEITALIEEYSKAIDNLKKMLQTLKKGGKFAKGGNTDSFDWHNMSYPEKAKLVQESGLPSKVASKELGLLTDSEISILKNSIRLRYSKGGNTDDFYSAKKQGNRKSKAYSVIETRDGSFKRKNGNQFVNKEGSFYDEKGKKHKTEKGSTGGSEYTEYRKNRADIRKFQ